MGDHSAQHPVPSGQFMQTSLMSVLSQLRPAPPLQLHSPCAPCPPALGGRPFLHASSEPCFIQGSFSDHVNNSVNFIRPEKTWVEGLVGFSLQAVILPQMIFFVPSEMKIELQVKLDES